MIVGIVVASYVSFGLNMNNNVLAEVERPGCFDLLRHLSFSRVDAKAPFRAKWPTRFSSGSACSVSLFCEPAHRSEVVGEHTFDWHLTVHQMTPQLNHVIRSDISFTVVVKSNFWIFKYNN